MAVSNGEGPEIGYDLGTTYSCVGVWRHDHIEIIQWNDQWNRTTPSYVAFTDSDKLIGDAAKNQVAMNPIKHAKRLIRRRFCDPANAQSDVKQWPFQVIAGRDGKPMIVVKHKGGLMLFLVEKISSMDLNKMKEIAEAYYLGSIGKNPVVTVPVSFNDSQRTTRDRYKKTQNLLRSFATKKQYFCRKQ